MRLTAILFLVALGGCALMKPPQQSFCSAARPIYPGKGDVLTIETTRLIVAHDEIGQKLCGWVPPEKPAQ